MNTSKTALALLCLASFISACSGGGSDSSGDSNASGNENPAPSSGSNNSVGLPSELRGKWVRNCAPADENPEYNIEWITSSLTFAANSVAGTELYYSDSTCSTPLQVGYNVQVNWSLTVHADAVSTPNGNATAVDWKTESTFIDGKPTKYSELYYDILKNIDGKLYFGDINQALNTGETAADRPTRLDLYFYYERP